MGQAIVTEVSHGFTHSHEGITWRTAYLLAFIQEHPTLFVRYFLIISSWYMSQNNRRSNKHERKFCRVTSFIILTRLVGTLFSDAESYIEFLHGTEWYGRIIIHYDLETIKKEAWRYTSRIRLERARENWRNLSQDEWPFQITGSCLPNVLAVPAVWLFFFTY